MRFLVAGVAGCLLWTLLVSAAPAPATTPVQPGEIIAHLARAIAWYRHVTAVEQSTQVTGDVLARDNEQRTATRALQLAFDFARAAAPWVTSAKPASGAAALSEAIAHDPGLVLVSSGAPKAQAS